MQHCPRVLLLQYVYDLALIVFFDRLKKSMFIRHCSTFLPAISLMLLPCAGKPFSPIHPSPSFCSEPKEATSDLTLLPRRLSCSLCCIDVCLSLPFPCERNSWIHPLPPFWDGSLLYFTFFYFTLLYFTLIRAFSVSCFGSSFTFFSIAFLSLFYLFFNFFSFYLVPFSILFSFYLVYR